MDLILMIVLIAFVMFALTLIFLGIRTGNKKKIIKHELKDQIINKPVKNEKKEKEKFFTNKLIVSSDVNKMQYHGSTPFIEVDENWMQMPLDRTVLTIARETLTRMFPLAYLAGKLSVMEQAGKIGLVMILLFILVIGNLALTYWKSETNSAAIKSVQDSSTNNYNDINNKVSNNNALTQLIAEKLNITGNYTIPTVGG